MKKIFVAMLLIPFMASARHLSADEAWQRMQASGAHKIAPAKAKAVDLAYSSEGGYVFAQDSTAFWVLPADDALPAVIGYGDAPAAEIPDAMKWWLSTVASSTVADVATHAAIAPLLTTKWDQSGPFNDLCPKLDDNIPAMTGCVATAIAQVLNYHHLPATHGFGTHSYTLNGKELSFDYESTTFDWGNMLNEYEWGNYTADQADAVATLMLACGVGVNMDYSATGSGAYSQRIHSFLRNHMGVDKGVAYLDRDFFSPEEWDEIVYGELAANRPVIYSGQAEEGGHCFVCDGYRADGGYHINWGWGGYCDGYFLLTNLIGDGRNYSSYPSIVVGIQPPQEGSQTFLPLYASGGFEYINDRAKGFYFAFIYDNAETCVSSYTSSYTDDQIDFYAGLKLVSEEGLTYYLTDTTLHNSRQTEETEEEEETEETEVGIFRRINASSSNCIPAGKYTVTPVVRPVDGTEWQPIFFYVGDNKSLTASTQFHVDEFEQPADFINGKSIDLFIKVSNYSNEDAQFRASFKWINKKTGEVISTNQGWSFYGIPGNLVQDTREFANGVWPEEDGEYFMYAYDANSGLQVSDYFTVHVGVRPTEVKLSHSEVTLELAREHTFSASVFPTNAYDGTVTWSIDDDNVAEIVVDSKLRANNNDQSVTVRAKNPGTATISATTVNGLKSAATITVNDSGTAITEVEAADAAATPCYDLQGRRVTTPTRGLYVRRNQIFRL